MASPSQAAATCTIHQIIQSLLEDLIPGLGLPSKAIRRYFQHSRVKSHQPFFS